MSLSTARLEQYRSITLSDVLKGKSCEGCKLPLRLLNVKKSERNNRAAVYTFRRGSSKPVQTNTDYDRMFLCGDLVSNSCCVFFTRTTEATRILVPESCGISVGELIVVAEPRFVNQYLDQHQATPILRISLPLSGFTNTTQLPFIPIEVQGVSFVHFYLKNVSLSLNSFRLVSTCGGSFCNRLVPSSTGNPCGCVTKPTRSSFALEADVDIEPDGDGYSVSDCLNGSTISGLRFTRLFMDDEAIGTVRWKNFDLQSVKDTCKQILPHIHSWAIAGWTKTPNETEDHVLTEARIFHIVDAIPQYVDGAAAGINLFTPPPPKPVDGKIKGPRGPTGRETNDDDDNHNDNVDNEGDQQAASLNSDGDNEENRGPSRKHHRSSSSRQTTQ
ncbi:hypothetical protein FOZ60_005942 [Perkinsus olseni]|uniref:Uncharacterized protein n=1 Tax=Perkinsus olseni TaxID=32597 RepID=A0A7J6NPU8_PEROL|nr:hypothetical protein FOZ60_005942 [Perkinsus olseni]